MGKKNGLILAVLQVKDLFADPNQVQNKVLANTVYTKNEPFRN